MNRRAFISSLLAGTAVIGSGAKLDLREWTVVCGFDTLELFRSGAISQPGARQFVGEMIPYRLSKLTPPTFVAPIGTLGKHLYVRQEYLDARYEVIILLEYGQSYTAPLHIRCLDRQKQRLL